MIFGQPRFLLDRYEALQIFIRKKKFNVDKERLSIFYSILFFVSGTPLLIVAIIGLIKPEIDIWIFTWVFVTVVCIGLVGILYCSLSKQFIQIS